MEEISHHFGFDRVWAVVGHQHRKAVVERLAARSEVGQDERDVYWAVRRLQDKVVGRMRSSAVVLDSMGAIVHLKQTLHAGGRGRGNLMTLDVSSCCFIRRRHQTHQRLILAGHGRRTRRGWLKRERGYRVCGNERGAVKCSGWVRRRKANAGRMHDESRPRYIRTAGGRE